MTVPGKSGVPVCETIGSGIPSTEKSWVLLVPEFVPEHGSRTPSLTNIPGTKKRLY